MPTFDADEEEITAFPHGDTYLFKQYLDEDQLYNQLKKYYNSDKYRFEVPENDLDQVRQLLDEYYYTLRVTDDIEEYSVVIEKEADSSNTLRNSVMRQQRGLHEIFVIKDELSTRQSVENGAVRIEESRVKESELPWISHRP